LLTHWGRGPPLPPPALLAEVFGLALRPMAAA